METSTEAFKRRDKNELGELPIGTRGNWTVAKGWNPGVITGEREGKTQGGKRPETRVKPNRSTGRFTGRDTRGLDHLREVKTGGHFKKLTGGLGGKPQNNYIT